MNNNYFIYILVKDKYPCFKIGRTTSINHRLKKLLNYGTFDIKKSKLLILNSFEDSHNWELDIQRQFKEYNLQIVKTKYTNGETEWFHIDCLDSVINYINLKLNNYLILDEGFISFSDKVKTMLQLNIKKQSGYEKKVQFALYQYNFKKNNLTVFNKIAKEFKLLNIIGIDKVCWNNKHKYKILCEKDSNTINFIENSNFKVVNGTISLSSTLCTSITQNEEYICYTFEFNNDSIIAKHWISKYFIKKLKNFCEKKSKTSIPESLYDFVHKKIDYENSKVIFTGNLIIDDFLFSTSNSIDRYLPQNISDELLSILLSDFIDFIEERNPKNYVLLTIINILTYQQNYYKDRDNTCNEFNVSFKIDELYDNLLIYHLLLNFEMMKRNGDIIKYTKPTINNIFNKSDDKNMMIEFNPDLIASYIMEEIFTNKN